MLTPKATLTIMLLISSLSTFSQSGSAELLGLRQLWEENLDDGNSKYTIGDIQSAHQLITSSPPNTNAQRDFRKTEILDLESEALKKDPGLNVSANYLENFGTSAVDEDNLIYNRRFQTSLNWNILKNGFAANKLQSQIKSNQSKIARSELEETYKQTLRLAKWHYITYVFNDKKTELLNMRKELAVQKTIFVKKLNLFKLVSQEDLIREVSNTTEIESMYAIYTSYNEMLNYVDDSLSVTADDLPLIDLDYEYTLDQLEFHKSDSLIALELENLVLKNKGLHDVSLAAFLKYNFYDLNSANLNYRSFVSAGVKVGYPIRFNKKYRDEIIQAEALYIEHAPNESVGRLQRDLLTQFYEFRYKLKQFNNLYYKRLLFKELIRQQDAKKHIDPYAFNPVDALQLIDELLQIEIELVDTKQQMYLKALNLYTDLPGVNIQNLIVKRELQDSEILSSPFESIYIWSKSMASYSPEFISNYLNLNGISKMIVSLNQDSLNQDRLKKFIKTQGDLPNIQVLISKNKLKAADVNTYFKSLGITDLKANVSGIHLDVEVHTLEGYKANKPKFLSDYIELVTKAKAFCDSNGLKLAISIPLTYGDDVNKQLIQLVDEVYFMCYENVTLSHISRKLAPLSKDKIVIALRTKDFKNRLEMEEKVKELKVIKPRAFSVHDISSLLELEKNAILKRP